MTTTAATDLSGLAQRLADLWSAELCSFDIEFEERTYSGNEPPSWRVDLTWTDENNNPHRADWATYTWSFYGDTADRALLAAVDWCEQLAPLKRCDACDGEGSYNVPTTSAAGRTPYDRVTCEDCGGTGLAHNEPTNPGEEHQWLTNR